LPFVEIAANYLNSSLIRFLAAISSQKAANIAKIISDTSPFLNVYFE